MRAAIIIALAMLLAGCSTRTRPDRELRVTEYGADGSYLGQAQGQLAGCRAVQAGEIEGCMVFEGTTCTFTSAGCPQ